MNMFYSVTTHTTSATCRKYYQVQQRYNFTSQ